MKLRLKNDSLRLRLSKSETAHFAETGHLEETIEFGPESFQKLTYTLEAGSETEEVRAVFEDNRLRILVPGETSRDWARTDSQIALEAEQATGREKPLRLLIEKDLGCFHASPDDVSPGPRSEEEKNS
jgi:hypothetical protein